MIRVLSATFVALVCLGQLASLRADEKPVEPIEVRKVVADGKLNFDESLLRVEVTLQSDRRHITIVTLGDSITKGMRRGVTSHQTFASLLETQLRENGTPVRVINVGIGGERTDQALKRLDRVIALKPDIVTMMYGTNDSYVDPGKTASRITLDEYRSNLSKLVTGLLRRGIRPVLMTEPRWADDARPNGLGEHPNVRLEPYVAACRKTAREWRVPLVDHFATWTESRETGVTLRAWTTDGCHPNPVGHRELAAAMLPVIQQAIGPELKTRRQLMSGESIRVVCFGDSVTGVYYHTGSRRAYTDMLGIALRRANPRAKVEMINAGISGHTTVNALARIDRDVLSHQPDLVTVMFGLNDMTRVPLDEYRANLKEIVANCRAAESEVVLATPNNIISTSGRPTEKLIQYCDVVREVGRELSVPVCDSYRELDAIRSHDRFDWRLLMSDAIHPNMDGHKRLATALAQTITGLRVSLEDVPPPQPAVAKTLALLRDKKPIHVLAMPPFDELIEPAIREFYPGAEVKVEPWPVEGLPLAKVEQDAKARVRKTKPDLVLIAVSRTATAETNESFVHSYAWIMNWSLNFGPPTWDCVVVHPSVPDPNAKGDDRDSLVRRLVRAQDLRLIDRPPGSKADASSILRKWLRQQADEEVIYNVELADPASPSAPARVHRVVQFRDQNGFPVGYALRFATEVCTDKQCRLAEVTMVWNAIGYYERLECLPGKPLTKKKHVPFEPDDYARLDRILRDRNSILATQPVTFFAKLVEEPKQVEDPQGMDALTSATPLAVQESVVKDAAYTTWVMWRWANGAMVQKLLAITEQSCTPRYLKYLLRSQDRTCVDFALKYVMQHHPDDAQYMEEVLHVLETGDRDHVILALRFLSGATKDQESLHARLIESCCRMKETYSPIVIRFLAAERDLPRTTLEGLTAHLDRLTFFPIHLILRLLEERAFFSERTESDVVALLDSDDFFIARRACEYLMKQDLRSEAEKKVTEFRKQNRDRL
ncbi:MAG: SGNH/GDSL hydrolase family protein [Pirellulaceae bacterium]